MAGRGAFKVVVAILLYCATNSAASTPKPRSRNPYDSFVGTTCQPPFGFRPKSCGDYEVLTEIVTPAPDFVYGPNTCRFQRMVRVNELNYEYQKYCDWAYSKAYYVWVQQCQLICQPTRVCSDRNQTIDVSSVNCCPGFRTIPPKAPQHYNYYYTQHYSRIETLPVGCPRANGESLLECLRLHNLTRFVSFLEESMYLGLLSANNSEVTVLAPTNEAFALVGDDRLAGINPDMLIGNHIVNRTVQQSEFTHNRQFTNVEGLVLHSTLVHFPDYSVITYQTNSQYSNNNAVRFREVMFINGARIQNGDACHTRSGMLHIIDRVLMPSDDTVANILEDDPQFSMFVAALKFAGTFQFLNISDTSHTVFAPTNDAFARAIPPDLFTCLTSYMRIPLTNLVLYHISKQTDYSSILSLRQSAFTLLTDHGTPQVILVVSADNGTLFLGALGNQIPITTADIPASNGVIHVIDGVLMPSNFDYGQCQRFVPTTMPPTTQPPTTLPATTPTLPGPDTAPTFSTTPTSATTAPVTDMAPQVPVPTSGDGEGLSDKKEIDYDADNP